MSLIGFRGDCLLGLSLSYFSCYGFTDPKYHLFWFLNFCSILTTYRQAASSDEMSRKSISVWMYLCRAPRYFKTKCRSEVFDTQLGAQGMEGIGEL
jgi:hypothetical protein